MQVAGVLHHLATQVVVKRLALTHALIGFANLRAGLPAVEQRNVELQTNRALFSVAAIATAPYPAVAIAEVVVVAYLVAHYCIYGRRMPGLACVQRLLRHLQGPLADP
ncbi:hypothetical protein D3C84_514890 [compost metagenome]